MEKNIHWRKCNGVISGVCGEYFRDMGYIGILWSWRLKPFNKVSQEHGGVKVGMRLKLKDSREVEVNDWFTFLPSILLYMRERNFKYTHMRLRRKLFNMKEFQIIILSLFFIWMLIY